MNKTLISYILVAVLVGSFASLITTRLLREEIDILKENQVNIAAVQSDILENQMDMLRLLRTAQDVDQVQTQELTQEFTPSN